MNKQTLIWNAQFSAAILVINDNGKRRSEPRRFKDAHAALSWCERQGCGMVYVPNPNN